jgi:diguanylate cyclase (GGDEF)-like protein
MYPEIHSKIDTRLENAYLLTYKSLREAQEEAENCLDESEKISYFKGMINSRILLSLIALNKGEIDLARERLTLIEEELNASSSVSEDSLMRVSQVRATYFLSSAVYKDAFDSFVKCGNMAARLGNNLFQVLSANGKGIIKLDQMEFEDAFDYFRVARTYLHGGNLSILGNVLTLNMGCALNGLERYDEALDRLNDALEEATEQDSPMMECSILDEIGAMLIKQNRFEEARKYLEKALEKSSLHLYQEAHTQVVYHYATLLLKMGEYDKAEKLIDDLGESQVFDLDPIMYHQVAAEIFEQKGDCKRALNSCKEILMINEKLRSSEVLHSVFKQEKRELQDQNHRLQLVSTIGQELVSTLDLGEILNLIYAQMNVLMPVDLLSISTVKGNKINVKFTLNKGARIEPFTLHKENPDSVLAWCVRNKQEVFIRSISADADKYVRNITPIKGNENNLLESVICIPLLHLGELEGVISVQGKKPNSYNSQDLDNLRAMASYVGIAIRNAIQTEQMTELNKLLKYQSSVDSLTGLVNRREFLRQSTNILRVCRRNNFPISLVMIDLDNFKIVNDSYGHLAGDDVLKAFGSLLGDYFKRPLDCVGRYGGEELIVLTGDLPAAEVAARIELLREEFSTVEFTSGDDLFKVNFSCGIYGELPQEDSSEHLEKITSLADKYLYRAKEEGRNCSFLSDKKDKPAEKFIFSKFEN